jgi:hypothetical protein
VLNDTSLVLIADVHLDGRHRRRVLFPGDLENWSYLAARWPTGLGIDLLKAPHHGGRVYLERQVEAYAPVYTWLRPRTVFVSADGQHQLPRRAFRDAMRQIGATLLCPNRRTLEPLTPGFAAGATATSCFECFGCRAPEINARGATRIDILADGETSDSLACLQGSGQRESSPIIVLEQRIVEPSEAFVRFTQSELDRHANWIKRQLTDIHEKFFADVKRKDAGPRILANEPVLLETILTLARNEGRHSLVADPSPVLRYGAQHQYFWVEGEERWGHRPTRLYRLPGTAEIESLRRWVGRVPELLVPYDGSERLLEHGRPLDVLQNTNLSVLAAFLAFRTRSPIELAQAVLVSQVQPVLATRFSAQAQSEKWSVPSTLRLLNRCHPRDSAITFDAVVTSRLKESAEVVLNQDVWAGFARQPKTALIGCIKIDGRGALPEWGLPLAHFHAKYRYANFDSWLATLRWRQVWD